jgi:hypothetical protein
VSTFARAPPEESVGGGAGFLAGLMGGSTRGTRTPSTGVTEVSPLHSEFIEYASLDEACVVLEILTPPYDANSWTHKRTCTYYTRECTDASPRGDSGLTASSKAGKASAVSTQEAARAAPANRWRATPIKWTKETLALVKTEPVITI